MSYVLRVENEDGIGPYWAGDIHHDTSDENHPSPVQDPCVTCAGGTIADEADRRDFDAFYSSFGFDSIEQLRSWFTDEELDRLGRYGHAIVVVEVDDDILIRGERQVAFFGGGRTILRADARGLEGATTWTTR